jgi:hypothetical protein
LNLLPEIYTSISLSEALQNIDAATTWLKEIGYGHGASRFMRYRQLIDSYVNAAPGRQKQVFHSGHERFYTAIMETYELEKVYRYLVPKYSDYIRARISHMAKGPESYKDEVAASSSNRPRNIGFELGMMADLVRSGLTLETSVNADVAGWLGSKLIIFECKRPQTNNAVPANYKAASEQLKLCCAKLDGSIGVVAVDISKIFNPHFHMPILRTPDDIYPLFNNTFANFLNPNIGWWNNAEPHVSAVYFRLKAVVRIASENVWDPFTCTQGFLNGFKHTAAEQQKVLKNLTEKMTAIPGRDIEGFYVR